METRIPRVVLAGLRGGSGKTTLSLGLAAEFRRRGTVVAPFKKGPDYIDAGWLGKAAGRPCRNLDPFLMDSPAIAWAFMAGAGGADIALVEGNRGVFDGVDTEGTYSTAELAKLLRAPVILVVDCTKSTRTVGALVLGCRQFDPDVPFGGVVLNRVAGTRQETLVRQVVEERTGLPVVGALPRRPALIGERHMGLTTHREAEEVDQALEAVGTLVREYVQVDRIADIARGAGLIDLEARVPEHNTSVPTSGVRIGVLSDTAFQFYYPENLEALEGGGVEIVSVNALSDPAVPGDIHALYIGGGFPETQAARLHENTEFRRSLRDAAEDGLPIYAECGGLIFLGTSIRSGRDVFDMAGVLPISFSMEKKPAAHGYTVLDVHGENAFYNKGLVLKGHEFHYSAVTSVEAPKEAFAFRMTRGRGIRDGLDGLTWKKVLGTYTHVHALGTPEWVSGMVRAARQRRDGS